MKNAILFQLNNSHMAKRLIFLLLPIFIITNSIKAQTDTEFWFVVPEITIDHQAPGGVPASLRFSSGSLPATVTISMPANSTVFPDIVFNLAPNDFYIVDLSCWIVTPCNPPFTPATGYSDINLIENKPYNASGINNLGIQITSTAPITAYYEVSRTLNKEIWSLKGQNGLGTEFFTPFQTHGNNWSGGIVKAYSSIDIVATDDNTSVTFTLPPGIAASYGYTMAIIPAGNTHTINLSRGQTFSLVPEFKVDRISQVAADRLRGVKINSDKPIAVIVKDDSYYHSFNGCYDISGDQLVPTNLIGNEYIVLRSELTNFDHIYMLATNDTTTIMVFNASGVVVSSNTINAQEQWYRQLPVGQEYYRVVADKPIYVWHVGGFGCEQGGALLPPIDRCNGSTNVSFARTSNEPFYILLMVRNEAENSFRFMVQTNPFSGVFEDKTSLFAEPFSFVPGSEWSVKRYGPFTVDQVPVTNHYIENTKDVFHLGVINGGSNTGCFYGYFSNFNEMVTQAVIVDEFLPAGKICYGSSAQLYATGGFAYHWFPEETLDDPNSPMPIATPLESTTYSVEVTGACYNVDTAEITILVSDYVKANFVTDIVTGETPLEVTFSDLSIGASVWQFDFGDGTDSVVFTSIPSDFSHTFTNNTEAPVNYYVQLLVTNNDFCADTIQKTITVYPSPIVNTYLLSVEVNPENAGEVLGAGEYEQDSEITLTASPSAGFEFVNWTYNGVEISTSSTFIYTMPSEAITITANFQLVTYSVSFNVYNSDEVPLTDAFVILNGAQNEQGIYLFSGIEPGTYNFTISRLCSSTVEGQLTVLQSNELIDVTMEPFYGDASGDLLVNLTDISQMVSHIFGVNAVTCFINSDVIIDEVINIRDIIATVNIMVNSKRIFYPNISSKSAQLYLNSTGISLVSDGNIQGLQLEILNLQNAIDLAMLLPSHQLEFVQTDGKITLLIYSIDNTPIPAGEINLVSFGSNDEVPLWGNNLAANANADLVTIESHEGETGVNQLLTNSIDLKVYPNPVRDNLSISFINKCQQSVKVKMVNLKGQVVLTKDINEIGKVDITFNTTTLNSGSYFLSIDFNGEIVNRVVVIQ
jgi:hypothetical protein